MLEIKTNQLKTRKKQVIDGHEYTIRKMGNIEMMNLSQYTTRLQELADIEKKQKLTVEQSAEVDKISESISFMTIGLFDDGGDQSKSRQLIPTLSDEEINYIFAYAYDELPKEKVNEKAN